jgi:hypothetical protein
MSADRFFAYARARHEITLKRAAGLPRPWTSDPILDTYRFTNVFRELDRVTLWIDRHVRQPLNGMLARGEVQPWQAVLGMVLTRTFNRTETLEQIFCQERLVDGLEPCGWAYIRGGNAAPTTGELEEYMRRYCPKPWVTGAYIVKTPDGMDKLAGALWIVEQARHRLPTLAADGAFARSMESLHADLVAMPYLGGFTAYEIVSDVRWLRVGRDWPDIMSWAHAGPGAIRGLHRVYGRWDIRTRKSMSGLRTTGQAQALAEMRELLTLSRDGQYWPNAVVTPAMHGLSGGVADWPLWEMREVEHTLCEMDKHERVRNGEGKPRQIFR